MFLRYVEVFIFFFLLIVAITQIVWPLMAGKKMFWLFRKRAQLENKLMDAVQASDDDKLSRKIETINKARRNRGKH